MLQIRVTAYVLLYGCVCLSFGFLDSALHSKRVYSESAQYNADVAHPLRVELLVECDLRSPLCKTISMARTGRARE